MEQPVSYGCSSCVEEEYHQESFLVSLLQTPGLKAPGSTQDRCCLELVLLWVAFSSTHPWGGFSGVGKPGLLQGKGSLGALSLAARLGPFCPLLMWPGPFHGGLHGGTCRQTRGVLPPHVQALSLSPLSQADKERHFPSYLVFSSWIYLFILLPSWDFFFNFYFSHAYLKTAFQASWGLVGCVTSSAVGIPLCLLPAPGIPFSSLPLQPFVQEP